MKPRAFTIVELLVIMGIIAILISLVVVGMHTMQQTAARTQSVNALRQMVAGYLGYSADNRNRLMPGYLAYKADTPDDLLLNAKLASTDLVVKQGTPWNQREMLHSYVWRLAPYVDHNWKTMMVDYREPGALQHLEGTYTKAYDSNGVYDNPDALIDISMMPAYGLNSIFLGGDNYHGGTDITDRHPWTTHPSPNPNRIAATRMTEVLSPANIIVFAPTGYMNAAWKGSGDNVYRTTAGIAQARGYPELRPPFLDKGDDGIWRGEQWNFQRPPDATGNAPAHLIPRPSGIDSIEAGLPILRHGREHLPVAHLDGSARVESILEVARDMRKWAPDEVGLQPPPFDPDAD